MAISCCGVQANRSSLNSNDSVGVLAAQDCHDTGSPIEYQRKHVENVSTENAHIKSSSFTAGGERAPKEHEFSVIANHPNDCVHNDRIHRAPDTDNGFNRRRSSQFQRLDDVRTQDGAVGGTVDKKLDGAPGAVRGLDFRAQDRADHAVITLEPLAVKSHRSGSP